MMAAVVDASTLARRADAVLAQPAGRPVTSPCVSVCLMDPGSGLCQGCLRSLDEIADWSGLTDEGRRDVWVRIARRLREAGIGEPPPSEAKP
ncbi:DUF1289 domain-containing protein [Variovorax sp.]|uniref:DUF1289 domain-containing protein n=1 Tax=Variovorax sp. TaxID=1871043 RepID=UPI002D783991|nr:DUF1289 domain-containing protein [Variovorax sp.]